MIFECINVPLIDSESKIKSHHISLRQMGQVGLIFDQPVMQVS
jgi:hypothetical protein